MYMFFLTYANPYFREYEEAIKDDNKVSEKPTEDSLDAGSKDNKDEAANEAGEKEAEEDKVFSVTLLLFLLICSLRTFKLLHQVPSNILCNGFS